MSILFFKKNVTLTAFLSLSQTTSCLASCFQKIDGRVLRPILHHDSLLTEIFEPLLGGILGQAEKEAQGMSGDETILYQIFLDFLQKLLLRILGRLRGIFGTDEVHSSLHFIHERRLWTKIDAGETYLLTRYLSIRLPLWHLQTRRQGKIPQLGDVNSAPHRKLLHTDVMQFPEDGRHISLGERAPILNGCFLLLVCHRLMLYESDVLAIFSSTL